MVVNAFIHFREVNQDVWEERKRQVSTWGDQRHPSGTHGIFSDAAARTRSLYEVAATTGTVTWVDILLEEVAEAFAETDPQRLRHELVQVAAVVYAWIHDLDRTPAVDPNQQVLL